jgi:ubiquitin-protein ligase
MSPVRERRLRSDYEAVQAFIAASDGRVVLEAQTGPLAETYHLVFRCRSVLSIDDDKAMFGSQHRVRIYLPAQYPMAAPVAALRTPLFHPHVWPNGTVCLGTWNPAEKLDSVLARIGSILVFDPAGLNWRSVANEAAVPWARDHAKELPLDALFAAPVMELVL